MKTRNSFFCKLFHCKNIGLGEQLLLLTFFDNFDFWTLLFSKNGSIGYFCQWKRYVNIWCCQHSGSELKPKLVKTDSKNRLHFQHCHCDIIMIFLAISYFLLQISHVDTWKWVILDAFTIILSKDIRKHAGKELFMDSLVWQSFYKSKEHWGWAFDWNYQYGEQFESKFAKPDEF